MSIGAANPTIPNPAALSAEIARASAILGSAHRRLGDARAVRTVSSEQVRRPIFRDGLEQWRNFEPWLDPLKAALGPTLEHWRC